MLCETCVLCSVSGLDGHSGVAVVIPFGWKTGAKSGQGERFTADSMEERRRDGYYHTIWYLYYIALHLRDRIPYGIVL